MQLLISGSHGFIGSALVAKSIEQGHRVTRLVRTPARPGESAILWDPDSGISDLNALAGIDAVVHLAGASIIGRWTVATQQAIRTSRAITLGGCANR